MKDLDDHVRATLDDLASRRRHVTTAIVNLAAFYALDASTWLDGPPGSTVDHCEAPITGHAEVKPQKVPRAKKKGTKRAEVPTSAGGTVKDRILTALKQQGEPMAPRELEQVLGVKNLRYPLHQMIEARQVIASGVTSQRRIALP